MVKGLPYVWWLEFMAFNNNLPDVKGQRDWRCGAEFKNKIESSKEQRVHP
jgi:hypothetical protein